MFGCTEMTTKKKNEPFVTFSQQLAPLKGSNDFAIHKIQALYGAIERQSQFKYARKAVVGGAEHKTSIWVKMDYDCVVFVNPGDVVADWRRKDVGDKLDAIEKKVGDDWARFMRPNAVIAGTEAKVFKHLDSWRVELEFCEGEFSGDLLIGINAISPKEDFTPKRQATNMFNILNSYPEERKKQIALKKIYSVSVMQNAIALLDAKSCQAHEVARLAKFWSRFCCPLPHKVPGRSYLITIVATDAVGKEKQFHLDLFKCFLTRMTQPEQLSIDDSVGKNDNKASNRVMDPGNCFDNYLEGSTPMENAHIKGFLSLCRKTAQQTLSLIEEYQQISDPTWENLSDVFDIAGALDRHDLRHIPTKYVFSVDEFDITSGRPCFFPKIVTLSHSGLRSEAKKVMFLVCCAAAFIPRITVDKPTPAAQFVHSLRTLLANKYKLILCQLKSHLEMFSFQFPVSSQYGIIIRVMQT